MRAAGDASGLRPFSCSLHVGFTIIGVPNWGPYYEVILLFGGLYSFYQGFHMFEFVNPHMGSRHKHLLNESARNIDLVSCADPSASRGLGVSVARTTAPVTLTPPLSSFRV